MCAWVGRVAFCEQWHRLTRNPNLALLCRLPRPHLCLCPPKHTETDDTPTSGPADICSPESRGDFHWRLHRSHHSAYHQSHHYRIPWERGDSGGLLRRWRCGCVLCQGDCGLGISDSEGVPARVPQSPPEALLPRECRPDGLGPGHTSQVPADCREHESLRGDGLCVCAFHLSEEVKRRTRILRLLQEQRQYQAERAPESPELEDCCGSREPRVQHSQHLLR